jgi:hypothetical protein
MKREVFDSILDILYNELEQERKFYLDCVERNMEYDMSIKEEIVRDIIYIIQHCYDGWDTFIKKEILEDELNEWKEIDNIHI